MTSQPASASRRYGWLPVLIVLMTSLALGMGTFLLSYVERRLVAASGGELMLAAAEVSDKVDRLLFERYGDVQMMARAFALRSSDHASLASYLKWMKTVYAPVYLWLGVTNQQGVMIASTEDSFIGRDFGQSQWFQSARDRRKQDCG